jgi:hypothetical protein
MTSLTVQEARRYCVQPGISVALSPDDELFYERSESPSFVVKAPTEVRETISFILTLVNTVKSSPFEGGFIWFHIYGVGPLNSAYLGWKVIEDLRRANGDNRTLDLAPAQHFRGNEETELKLFLLQAITFGWNGVFLPSGFNCLITFTSTQRWFFHADNKSHLDKLFEALSPWSPAYENE